MIRHVSVRLISGPLLLAAMFLRLPTPATAQSVTATPATPTLTERLDRLAAEIDLNRIDLHVPGFAFEESAQGAVAAMNLYRPGTLPVMRLASTANGPALPTVDEIMKLRGIQAPRRRQPYGRRDTSAFLNPASTDDLHRQPLKTTACIWTSISIGSGGYGRRSTKGAGGVRAASSRYGSSSARSSRRRVSGTPQYSLATGEDTTMRFAWCVPERSTAGRSISFDSNRLGWHRRW